MASEVESAMGSNGSKAVTPLSAAEAPQPFVARGDDGAAERSFGSRLLDYSAHAAMIAQWPTPMGAPVAIARPTSPTW